MTFVLHLFGRELCRISFGWIGDDEPEYVDNTTLDTEIPFGFASPVHYDEEDEE